jgi:hypothetical protein
MNCVEERKSLKHTEMSVHKNFKDAILKDRDKHGLSGLNIESFLIVGSCNFKFLLPFLKVKVVSERKPTKAS